MKINVIALEGSGRNWVQSILTQHPSIQLWGESFPCLGWPNRHYPWPPTDADALVVIVRDKSCQEQSVVRRNFQQNVPEGMFLPETSLEKVKEQIKLSTTRGEKVLFFDYEAAVLYREAYVQWFFSQLGLRPIHIQTEWRDENQKSFKP